ncbi:MAG: hypothetical protein LBC80_01095 [Treponema sp.]|jgi:hypothetical protein|nr:hypothetical protein [Treponema sp.]
MKFYDIDNALQEAINAADKPVRLKIEIDSGLGFYYGIFEQDIIEANFYGLKETTGGTTARGDFLLDNTIGIYAFSNVGAGSQVKVSFSLGDGLPYFQRFVFYVDDKGIQDIRGEGRKRYVYIGLRDLSEKLRKTDDARDWTSPAVFTYSVVCDKTQPEKSLVHGIAGRAGLTENDIDCSTISVTLPYVRLRRNVWAELSSLAAAYRCHLECTPEKPLVFTHSPYQSEALLDDEIAHTFTGENIFHLRKISRTDLYRNTVRLKVNMPVSLGRQEIWRYDDPPVFYDEFLQPHYPFKYPLVREIESSNYEAKYKIFDASSKERNVIFADEIDMKEEAENRLEYDGAFSYTHYDVTTNHDKAVLTLKKEADGDLYNATIHGRPIVLDLNRSCFMRDIKGVNTFGTIALNVTGSYFSDYGIEDKHGLSIPHYEDWVKRELAERIMKRREFTVKTHKAVFNACVGARVKIKMKNDESEGMINAFSFRYKRDAAFVATFKIIETGGNNE